ncbi:MAG: hypothetical protein KC425_12050 [Anaerolineales bacterium]|nr:hypothetical protein [Anaerolineales bacterium]
MTFFFMFTFLAFALGIATWHRSQRLRRLALLLLAAYVCFGYFVLHKI